MSKKSTLSPTADRRAMLVFLAAIFAVALLVRLVHLADFRDCPTYAVPIFDARFYHEAAVTHVQTGGPGPGFFFQPYLYNYWLAGAYRVLGVDVAAVRHLQAVIGALTCVLAAFLAGHLFGRRVGWTAGLMAALCGPLIFFETELLSTGLATFLGLGLVALITCRRRVS